MSDWCEADVLLHGNAVPVFVFGEGTYKDTGCEHHPACLSCPFEKCVLEGGAAPPLAVEVSPPPVCRYCGVEFVRQKTNHRPANYCADHQGQPFRQEVRARYNATRKRQKREREKKMVATWTPIDPRAAK
jgi:hypothetical protein